MPTLMIKVEKEKDVRASLAVRVESMGSQTLPKEVVKHEILKEKGVMPWVLYDMPTMWTSRTSRTARRMPHRQVTAEIEDASGMMVQNFDISDDDFDTDSDDLAVKLY